jgi:YD repeat-containing protein
MRGVSCLILLILTVAACFAPERAAAHWGASTDAVTPNETRIYTYDPNGRLVSAAGPWGTNGANATGSFKYDALGNIREQKLGTRTIGITYDAAANRVAS